ncbi:MYND-type domain-containing protein [Mycena kentingensis (nom. inval.)]|nr:MYND-type domain-containing protein [Mycena kentingensis (nom. inval.)]
MHELLRLSTISQLPSIVQKPARDAAAGSADGLRSLKLRINRIPATKLHLLAAVCYHALLHCNRAQLPSLEYDSEPLALAQMALELMWSVLLPAQRLPEDAGDEVWSAAWPWIAALDDLYEQLPESPRAFYLSLPSFLKLYHSRTPARAAAFFSANPRVFAIAGRCWKAALVEEAQTPLDASKRTQVVRREAIHACLDVMALGGPLFIARGGGEALRQLAVGAGGSWPDLARLATRHLRQTNTQILKNDADFERVNTSLVFLTGSIPCDAEPEPPVLLALRRRGFIGLLTKSLLLLHREGARYAVEPIAAAQMLNILTRCMRASSEPQKSLRDALRAGLLRVLGRIAAGGKSTPEARSEIKFLLEFWIPDYCVSLTVLRALGPALDDVGALSPGHQFGRVGLGQLWDDTRALIRSRLQLLALYDSDPIYRLRPCDNLRCTNLAEDGLFGFKRCGGCRDAWYCSVECQRADWAGGHGANCAIIRAHYKGYESRIGTHDRAFHRTLLIHDFRANQVDICSALLSYISIDQHESRTVLQLSYECGRMRFKFSLADVRIPYHRVLADRAAAAGDSALIVAIHYHRLLRSTETRPVLWRGHTFAICGAGANAGAEGVCAEMRQGSEGHSSRQKDCEEDC